MREELKAYIDKHSLATVLQMLAEICAEKAAHVEDSWRDEALARHWMEAGAVLGLTSRNLYIRAVSA